MFGKSKKNVHDSSSAEDFIKGSLEGLKLQTGVHQSSWGLGTETSWNVDLHTGKLIFTFDDKIVEAPIMVVGTYDSTRDSFMWGWEHPSIPQELQEAALKAKKWGEEHKLPQFSKHVIECSAEDAWNYTAIAARLSGANGAYRGTSGATYIYMTFGEVSLTKK